MRINGLACIALVFSLILTAPIFSFNAFLAKSANYSLLNEHIIDVSHGNVSDLRLNMSIPMGSEIILSSHDYELQTDPFSNQYIYTNVQNPKMPFNFSAFLKVRSSASSIKSLPKTYTIDDVHLIYLDATDDVPSDDEDLRKLAQETVAGYDSDFEKISALAYWVNEYITYDLAYVGKNLSVYEIMQQKKGVCGDYSLLFTTLARSLGYPTRFVNGYAYSSVQEQWVGHAWNEVYLGKWVPVDATWLEVGAVDATHVPVSKLDTNLYSLASVSALVYLPDAKLFWHGADEFRSIPANNLIIDSTEMSAPNSNFEVGISHSRVDADTKFLVYLKYPAYDYRLLRAYMAPCTSDSGEIVILDQKEVWTATNPDKDSYLVWEAKTIKNIDKNVLYRCPLTLNSDYLEKATIDVEMQIFDTKPKSLEAAALHSKVSLGEMQTINVQSEQTSKLAYFLTDEFFLQKPLDEKGFTSFEFAVSSQGNKKAYIWTENSEPVVVQYDAGLLQGLKLFEIIPQLSYMEGEESSVKIKFDLQENFTYSDKRLSWGWGSQTGQLSLENLDGDELNISFTPEIFGNYLFSASLFDSKGQNIYSQSRGIQSYEKGRVSVNILRLTKLSENVSIAHLILNTSGPVENIWILVDGKKYELSSNEIHLDLEPKAYNAKVVWQDSSGKTYELPVYIREPTEEDEVEIVPGLLIKSKNANIAVLIGQGVAALIILVILVFLKRRREEFVQY